MKQYFCYKESSELPVESISLVGDFNNWNPEENPLIRNEEGEWHIEMDIAPGDYLYQFLINKSILLNDCLANFYYFNEEGKLASYLKINEEGQRLYNTVPYHLNIKKFSLMSLDEKGEKEIQGLWIKKQGSKITMNLTFNQVTGIHSVSTLWCNENERTCTYNDQALWLEEGQEEAELGFALEGDIAPGTWSVKLFIDGKYIMSQSFLAVEENRPHTMKELLPIGSVVLLDGSNKHLMITGRIQRMLEGGKIYDYTGCYYPEGIIQSNRNLLFNHEQIQEVAFTGFVNEDEKAYKKKLAEYLDQG